ncbi:MAG: ABC transporter substrate-binding protein [Candidatus Lustribacter sp.]|jgi:NitT/TauT family transport system substrate-binding protein
MKLSRQSFVAAGMAAFSGPRIASAATSTIRFGSTPDEQASIALWASRTGLFQRSGLDVEIQRLNSGAAVSAAVAGSSIDVGLGSVFNLILAHIKGIPFVLESVSATYNEALPDNAFIVAKNSPIASPAQLNGKTISTSSLSDLFALAISAWIDQNGGDAKTVNFVELPMPLAVDAVASGRVDGAFVVDPFLLQGLDSGRVRIIGHPYSSIAPRVGITYYFCLRSYAQANADALARFRSNIATGVSFARTHRDVMVPIIADYTRMSPDVVRRMPFLTGTGITPAMVQPVIDVAARYKFIPSAFPASDMIDPAALTSS